MAERGCCKVLLISPPTPGGIVDYQNPSIGLAYLAAIIEKNGYTVMVIDCPPIHITYEDLKQETAHFKPDIVGITSVTATVSSAIQTTRVIKEIYPKALTVLGGPHVTFMDEQILRDEASVDIIVRGEGEYTLLELVDVISKSKMEGLGNVAGITFRKDGQIIRTPDRPFIQNLDDLPRPAYEHLPLKNYRVFGKLILPVVTSRGCPFQCTFCHVPEMLGKKFRARSPKNVVDELEWLRDTHGADAFTFSDETFTYDKERVFEICEEIKNRKIGVPWNCQTRVDTVSRKLLAEMRAADCQLISFGVESGSQKILNAMKKETTVEQNERAVRWAKKAGLLVAVYMTVGYPGETADTLEQTMDFIRRTEPDDAFIYLATPFPGTELYKILKNRGLDMLKDWRYYEMQTPVFNNPFISFAKINKIRETYYNQLYSPSYILRQSLKRTFYSQIMAETALHQLMWRVKLPTWTSAKLKELMRSY